MFLAGSCGRDVGREMKLLLKCLKFETGLRGKAATSTRSTPNSGSCLILAFLIALSFVCLHGVEPTIMCCLFHLIRVLCLLLFLAVCLPVCPSTPSLPLRIFSHPNVLPMLGACQSPPAPHPIIITHWMPYGSLYNVLHEGTSEYFDSGHKSVDIVLSC